MIHMGDDFSRMTDAGKARPPACPQNQSGDPEESSRWARDQADWNQASADSTAESMLEKGIIQPGDL